MTDGSKEGRELFDRYLAARAEDPELRFEDWVRDHPEHSTELRAAYADWVLAKQRLGDTTEAVGGDAIGAELGASLEVRESIGSGAYGNVYRAFDPVLRREVALKVLDAAAVRKPGARRRFLQEARTLARLKHPNIVQVHSVAEHDGEIQLCLELLDGRTLGELVEADGPLAPAEAARIGADLCRALAAIHAEGLVHLDVKPGNVMRLRGGDVKLLDFGFARGTVQPDPDRSQAVGPLGGTPLFMSPEHIAARPEIGPRADLYSLGVLLYWLVAGRYPYEADSFDELREAVLDGRATPLLDVRPDVPPEFAAIVERAMASDAAERYASAGAMERALRELLAGAEAPSTEAPVAEPAVPPAEKLSPGRVALVILALAILGVFLYPQVARRPTVADASPPFRASARFVELTDDGNRELADGDVVHVGTRFALEIETDEPAYYYVFDEDEEDRWFCLAPPESGQLLAPGVHRLPPEPGFWHVNTPGGTEHLFVVLAPEPVPLCETLVDVLPPPEQGVGIDRSNLRGVGLALPVTTSPDAAGMPRLTEIFADFEQTLERGSAVRFLRVSLDHEE